MAISQETRVKVEALLAIGTNPQELASRYDIPYGTIMLWNRKLNEDRIENKDLETVMSVDTQTLSIVADRIKEVAPSNVVAKIDKLVDGVTALGKLEPKFFEVTLSLLEKAEEFISKDDLSVKDWAAISSTLGLLYANIYNKAGVNVNVLNQTQVSGEKLSMFKSTMKNA